MLTCFSVCNHFSTQPCSQTANPVWNESIIINTSDGLHSAHFVQLMIRNHGRGEVVGVVYIPISDFFSHEMLDGKETERDY